MILESEQMMKDLVRTTNENRDYLRALVAVAVDKASPSVISDPVGPSGGGGGGGGLSGSAGGGSSEGASGRGGGGAGGEPGSGK